MLIRLSLALGLWALLITRVALADLAAFDATSSGPQIKNACLLSPASTCIYAKQLQGPSGSTLETKYRKKFASLNLDLITMISDTDQQFNPQLAVLKHGDLLLLVFAGTEVDDLDSFERDWLRTNIKIKQIAVDGHQVPQGFHEAQRLMHNAIVAAIVEHADAGAAQQPL